MQWPHNWVYSGLLLLDDVCLWTLRGPASWHTFLLMPYINKTPATRGLTSQSSPFIFCPALLRSNWSPVSSPLPRNADDHGTVRSLWTSSDPRRVPNNFHPHTPTLEIHIWDVDQKRLIPLMTHSILFSWLLQTDIKGWGFNWRCGKKV